MDALTRDELMEYIKRLPVEVQILFREADRFVLTENDTLSDAFQIAAEIIDVFEKYARKQ